MVELTDRLERGSAQSPRNHSPSTSDIHTVDDLLRHYPRKYSDGMTVRGEGEELELEEGQHVTFVDVIAEVEEKPMKRQLASVSAPTRSSRSVTGDRR